MAAVNEHHDRIGPASPRQLDHIAMLYNGTSEYLDQTIPFIEEGLDLAEPMLVFAPASNLDLIRRRRPGFADKVEMLDAGEFGRNPARIIPRARRFADQSGGRHVRILGETVGPGHTDDELDEYARHEAAINLVFADVVTTIACLYDRKNLPAKLLDSAGSTHLRIVADGRSAVSDRYREPEEVLASLSPLAMPPGDAARMTFGAGDVRAVRRFVGTKADALGLESRRSQDLVLAVSEAVSNSLAHSGQGGLVAVWNTERAVVCEVVDSGVVPNPHLVGRIDPPPDAANGRGFWLMNQLCDLVQLRSDVRSGTRVRVTMLLG